MHKIMMAVLAVAVAGITVPGAAQAAVCKDAKGKFIKCPPAVVKTTVVTRAPMARPVVVTKTTVISGGFTRDKTGRCHYASGPKKGQFVKCG